ncbi:MAG: hypothetical protein A3H98_05885 [Bacteroidetes bacterium RIFCSPLOWO2_02_FULL_36_8]|nr:MAG: hypothetical protein A3H98_05885 [Bacteroidetes bacterium RIFCSPLOWO2_02_FULL_36_8]OFY68958.1 MAG: hypothetical protein A3G23_10380 [Bacteroidetes bacterium RIFCSPLOWO2_12_FULL_37_12]
MAPEEFKNLLSPDIKLSETQISSISEIISGFPYFSTAQLLKSKHDIQTNPEKSNEIFEKYSIFVHDPVMYRLWVNDDKIVENESINQTNPVFSNKSIQQTDFLKNVPTGNLLFELIINTAESIDSSRYGSVCIPQQVEPIVREQTTASEFVSSQHVETHSSFSPESQRELIDKFINEEPAITPVKNSQTDFSDTEKRALKSSEFRDEEFVSETLAGIFQRQGNTRKAISIYQKLQLKFPEKFTYFAGLLDELK